MRIRLTAGFGDEIALTGVVRSLKRYHPDEMIRIVRPRYPEIWSGNPHLNIGNRDDGNLYRLDPLVHSDRIMPQSYMDQIGWKTPLEDPTPEIYLTDVERRHDFGLGDVSDAIAIDTEAGWRTRRWPFSYWQELAVVLRQRGHRIIELGLNRERLRISHDVDLVGRTPDRRLLMVLLSRLRLYIGNDSGTFHMAAAVGTPQVVLFGPKRPQARAYRSTIALEDSRPCAPACGTICYRPPITRSWGDHCMAHISVETVLETIEGILNRPARVGKGQ